MQISPKAKDAITEQDGVHLVNTVQAEKDPVDKVVAKFSITPLLYRHTEQELLIACQEFCDYFNAPAKI
jgi:hypothetical protein